MSKKYLEGTKFEDLIGDTYGKLTVIDFDCDRHEKDKIRKKNGEIKSAKACWICVCKCGKQTSVEGSQLKSGKTVSCGLCYTFEDWCNDNNHQDYLDLWDYELNDCSPKDVNHRSPKKYWFKCEKDIHDSYQKSPDNLVSLKGGNKCKKCNSIGQYLVDNYGCNGINIYWSDKNVVNPYSISKGSDKKFYIKCSNGHDDYLVSGSHFTNSKTRCPICSNNKIVDGVNDFKTLHVDLMKYICDTSEVVGVSAKSDKMIRVKCVDCGAEKTMRLNSLVNQGLGCCVCSDGISFPEKIMGNILLQLNIKFKKEYAPKWAIDEYKRQRRYDFYIPSKKLIIEMDGGFHYNDNKMNGITSEESKIIDDWKDGVANEHGIKVVRIKSEKSDLKYIKKNILKSEISNIFTIENIDWEECGRKSSTSLLKKCCDMWNNGCTDTKIIGKAIGVDPATIRRYLKSGTEIGICVCNSHDLIKLRIEKSSTSNMNRCSKKVMVEENGMIFDSLASLQKISEDVYGEKFLASKVCMVCNGKRSHHKGFTFRYVD